MKTISNLMVLLLLAGTCMAASAPSDADPAATHKHAKKEKRTAASAEQINQLREMIQAQQAEIDQLKQQVAQRDQTNQQAATAAEQSAAAAQQQATAAASTAADTNAKVNAVQSDVAGLTTTVNTTTQVAQSAEKKAEALEHPPSIAYKGVHLTPGGFVAAEMLWRQHAENNDLISSYNGIPFNSTATANMTEFRASARQSRLSLLAEGKAGPTNLTGYYEADFLGAAPTANENQSSSFNLRQRQLFAEASMNGWSLTGGQTWSLLTLNKKGIEARGEWAPAQIDAQYVVGYTFARLMTMRVAKTFNNNMETFAFSIENPATLSAGKVPTGVINGGAGSGSLGNGNTYSTNLAPDVIAKIAFDPSFGHFEIKGVGRFFRDRVEVGSAAAPAGNNTKVGGGIGFAAIVPVMPKKVDFIGEALLGRGTARFGDSSNVDVTFRPNGSLTTIKNLQALAGIEAHPTSKLDLYFYGGDEYLGRNYTAGTTYGYGNPTAVSNASCYVTDSGTCAALMRNLVQGVTGFWYTPFKGGYGSLKYGMQYAYTSKATWADSKGLAPVANENMVFTSFRYYLP